jgi:hypothetical protein
VNCDAGEIDDVCDGDGQPGTHRSNDARLDITGQWATRFEACVIGITAGEFSPPLYFTTCEQGSAWKARRAIADALPMLCKASDINMVEIIENDQPADGIVRGEDVAAWLSRHGVGCLGVST